MSLALVARKPKARPRFHVTVAKPGCWCSKCARHRGRGEYLVELIALYESRLATFREELRRERAK